MGVGVSVGEQKFQRNKMRLQNGPHFNAKFTREKLFVSIFVECKSLRCDIPSISIMFWSALLQLLNPRLGCLTLHAGFLTSTESVRRHSDFNTLKGQLFPCGVHSSGAR